MDKGGPISPEEMVELFGSEMPIEAVNLLFGSDGGKTCGELRAELRAIAASRSSLDKLEEEMARAMKDHPAVADFCATGRGEWLRVLTDEERAILAQACAVIARKQVEELTEGIENAYRKGADVAVFIANQRQNPQPPTPRQLDALADFIVSVRSALHRKGVEPK